MVLLVGDISIMHIHKIADATYHHRQSPLRFVLMLAILFLFITLICVISSLDISIWFLILVGLTLRILFWGLTVEVNEDIV